MYTLYFKKNLFSKPKSIYTAASRYELYQEIYRKLKAHNIEPKPLILYLVNGQERVYIGKRFQYYIIKLEG